MSKANTIGTKYHRIRICKKGFLLICYNRTHSSKFGSMILQNLEDILDIIMTDYLSNYRPPKNLAHISHEAIQYSRIIQGLNITPLYSFNLKGNLITDITPTNL